MLKNYEALRERLKSSSSSIQVIQLLFEIRERPIQRFKLFDTGPPFGVNVSIC
jgi:hypothetical protein